MTEGGVGGMLFGEPEPADEGGLGLYPASLVTDRGKKIYCRSGSCVACRSRIGKDASNVSHYIPNPDRCGLTNKVIMVDTKQPIPDTMSKKSTEAVGI